jgi:hypothetical protein
LAGQLLAEPPIPYRVAHASIEASDLVWAGERVEFKVERAGALQAHHSFSGTVLAEERAVASMRLVLEAVP